MLALKVPEELRGYIAFSLSDIDVEWLLAVLRSHVVKNIVEEEWNGEWVHALLSAPELSFKRAMSHIREHKPELHMSHCKSRRCIDVVCVYRVLPRFDTLLQVAVDWTYTDACDQFIIEAFRLDALSALLAEKQSEKARAGFNHMRALLQTL